MEFKKKFSLSIKIEFKLQIIIIVTMGFFSVRCHIVHLSASEALDIVSEAKKNNVPLTAETCYHYLTIIDDEIPNCDTRFKCCPPIRSKENRVIFVY